MGRANCVLTYADAHPVVVDLLLLRSFGPEYLLWEPETLWREILLTLRRHLSRAAKDKIQAVRLVHSQTTPFEEYEVFEKVIQAFNGSEVMFHVMQPPTLPFLLMGVDAMKLLRKQELSDEVLRYCAAVLQNEGVQVAPPPIERAGRFLRAGEKTRREVLSRASNPKKPLLPDNPLDVQAKKIRGAQVYRGQARALMVSQLGRIR